MTLPPLRAALDDGVAWAQSWRRCSRMVRLAAPRLWQCAGRRDRVWASFGGNRWQLHGFIVGGPYSAVDLQFSCEFAVQL